MTATRPRRKEGPSKHWSSLISIEPAANFGGRIAITADHFDRLSAPFLAELERTFVK